MVCSDFLPRVRHLHRSVHRASNMAGIQIPAIQHDSTVSFTSTNV